MDGGAFLLSPHSRQIRAGSLRSPHRLANCSFTPRTGHSLMMDSMKIKQIITLLAGISMLASSKAENNTGAENEASPAGQPASKMTKRVQNLNNKLNNIIIPEINFHDITVAECLDILRIRIIEFDPEPDEKRKGINFVIRNGNDNGKNIGDLKVSELRLKNIPLGTALQYICSEADLRYIVEAYAVVILPAK